MIDTDKVDKALIDAIHAVDKRMIGDGHDAFTTAQKRALLNGIAQALALQRADGTATAGNDAYAATAQNALVEPALSDRYTELRRMLETSDAAARAETLAVLLGAYANGVMPSVAFTEWSEAEVEELRNRVMRLRQQQQHTGDGFAPTAQDRSDRAVYRRFRANLELVRRCKQALHLINVADLDLVYDVLHMDTDDFHNATAEM